MSDPEQHTEQMHFIEGNISLGPVSSEPKLDRFHDFVANVAVTAIGFLVFLLFLMVASMLAVTVIRIWSMV